MTAALTAASAVVEMADQLEYLKVEWMGSMLAVSKVASKAVWMVVRLVEQTVEKWAIWTAEERVGM
jgi:hypothetical protein